MNLDTTTLDTTTLDTTTLDTTTLDTTMILDRGTLDRGTLDRDAERSLVDGLNHIAVTTTDLDRFVAFWSNTCGLAFHAEVDGAPFRHGMLMVGPGAAVHVFELGEEITGAVALLPMFGRGRIDHFALNAPDEQALRTIRDRLVDAGASDGTVTLFDDVPGFAAQGLLSVHIEDPDGGHSEICCARTGAAFTEDELTPFAPPTSFGPA